MSCPCQPREKGWLCSFFTYSCRKCHLVWWSCGCTVRLSFLYAHAHTSHLDSTCHHWELSALSCVAWVLILCVFVCVCVRTCSASHADSLCARAVARMHNLYECTLRLCVWAQFNWSTSPHNHEIFGVHLWIFKYFSIHIFNIFVPFLFVWALVRNVFRFGRKLKKLMYQHQDDNYKKKKEDQKVDDSRKILEQSLKEHEK